MEINNMHSIILGRFQAKEREVSPSSILSFVPAEFSQLQTSNVARFTYGHGDACPLGSEPRKTIVDVS